ncbi:MAG: DoxX family membrane protein [Planctomycetota bacterium]|nr:MAG: DoxX family membrane protein [Planctomycetota bacterium]REK42515.1 MAG: DoxX family membrane protein [Planctomycetota bacterium]
MVARAHDCEPVNSASCRRWLHHLARLSLALVFLSAGISKLGDIPQFAGRIGDFGIVYDSLVVPAAWVLSILELLLGVGLALRVRGSLAAALVLLGIFIGVLAYGIYLGLDIECGCFGPGFHVNIRTQLIIDLGLVGWCGLVYWSQRQ